MRKKYRLIPNLGMMVLIGWYLSLFTECNAQGFYLFGRNKIQYMNFDWQILDTDHFQIYFYPEMRDLAERGAYIAEEAYTDLSRTFNVEIDRKVPLIFYSSHLHFQQTNVTPGYIPEGVGGFFEFLKGRVVIPSDGSISRFRRVIRHELVHVFTHYKINSVSKSHDKFFKGGVPLWFIEGLAECWSGPWDGQSEMVIRDAILGDYLVPLRNIESISGSYLMYKEGENFLRFVEEKYGPELILLIMENTWRKEKFHEIMEMVLRKPLHEIDSEWVYYLKKKYYPVMAHEDLPSMAARRLTTRGFNSKPAYYRDAIQENVVFISNRTGYTNIYLMPLNKAENSSKSEILVKGEQSAAFESFHVFHSKIDVNTAGIMVFISKRGGHDVLNFYDVAKRKYLKHYEFKDIVSLSSPSWSPDGRFVAVSGIKLSGNRDLFLIDYEYGTLQQITDDIFDERDPSWHPNGRYIAFSSDRTSSSSEGEYNLFVIDLLEQSLIKITAGKHNDYTPAWSPDGKYLAFTSDRGGATNIWISKSLLSNHTQPYLLASVMPASIGSRPPRINIDHDALRTISSPVQQFTHITTGIFDPEWTADGCLIFTSFEKFNFHLQYIANVLKDTSLRALNDSSAAQQPSYQAWAPKRISEGKSIDSRQYKKKYNLDVMIGQIGQDPYFGTSGGSIFAFSDMMGNDFYTLLLFNNAQRRNYFTNSFNVALTRYVQGRRTNFVYGMYNLDYRWFNNFDGLFDKNEYGGFLGIQYPFSSFSRLQATVNFSHLYHEYYESLKNTRQALLFSSYLSLIQDNSLWMPTGPIDGHRYTVSIGQTTDIQYRNISYYTVAFDYRHYFRLSLRTAYAIRIMNLYRHGKDPERLFMGGSWDLRGYQRFSLWGRKLSLISQELRFPLLDQISLGFPIGMFRLGHVRGAIFFDAGNAWENRLDEVLGSFGAGLRFNVGFLVLRFDVGKRIENNFKSISNDIFTQFFFGWDF